MNEWKDNHEIPLEKNGVCGDVYEVRYLDRHNVTRTASGFNGYPFGVYVDGVNGAELPGAEYNAQGHLSKAVPYARIKQWRIHEKPP